MTTEYATIRYETTDTGIARVTLAMPEKTQRADTGAAVRIQ